MKQTYYSIRTITASSQKEALSKVLDEDFSENDPICDMILTKSELINKLNYLKQPQNYVVEIPEELFKLVLTKEGYLATDHIRGKILICLYTRGNAINKARLFGGKAKLFKDKINSKKHYII